MIINGTRQLTLDSSEEALKEFCLTMNFIEIWIKPFKINDKNRTSLFCEEMIELFQKIPIAF